MNNIERQLQICLNKIEKWAMENGFKFSSSKTLGMHFCNKRGLHPKPSMYSLKALARLFIVKLNNVTERMLPLGTPISCS
jgi:hypothetical protein